VPSPSNPDFGLEPLGTAPIEPPADAAVVEDQLAVPPPPRPGKDPPWSGWDVVALACLTLFTIFGFMLVAVLLARKLFYPSVSFGELAKYPGLIVLSQAFAYLAVFGYMYVLGSRDPERPFLRAIRWNFPSSWTRYLLFGVVLSIGLQLFARLLPIPKHMPMDQFFQTTRQAYMLSLFGITFAPFFEEMFFRGFLYPVLYRRLGAVLAVLLTAAAFALVHGAQLTYSWGPILVIFLVGLALTLVRATTKSVAAGLLVHVAYNATISGLMFAGTNGFRHLEKLDQ
jgi:membrane protease YdiL (CAAX protease family)